MKEDSEGEKESRRRTTTAEERRNWRRRKYKLSSGDILFFSLQFGSRISYVIVLFFVSLHPLVNPEENCLPCHLIHRGKESEGKRKRVTEQKRWRRNIKQVSEVRVREREGEKERKRVHMT